MATDLIKGEVSSPESYAGAMFGGAVGMNTGSAARGAMVATSAGEILENISGAEEREPMEILQDTAATGAIAGGTHFIVPKANLYLGMGLNECESNWTESILSGTGNGYYYNYIDSKKENLEQGKE